MELHRCLSGILRKGRNPRWWVNPNERVILNDSFESDCKKENPDRELVGVTSYRETFLVSYGY
jgi:hypothetical protein